MSFFFFLNTKHLKSKRKYRKIFELNKTNYLLLANKIKNFMQVDKNQVYIILTFKIGV